MTPPSPAALRYRVEPGDVLARELEIEVAMVLKNDLAKKLIQEAAKRNRPPVDLLADVVEAAIEDNLFAAILDD